VLKTITNMMAQIVHNWKWPSLSRRVKTTFYAHLHAERTTQVLTNTPCCGPCLNPSLQNEQQHHAKWPCQRHAPDQTFLSVQEDACDCSSDLPVPCDYWSVLLYCLQMKIQIFRKDRMIRKEESCGKHDTVCERCLCTWATNNSIFFIWATSCV